MKEFLEFVAQHLVDEPSVVRLTEEIKATDNHRSFLLLVPATEIGKIVGKQGHTIHAIRTLLEGAAARRGERVHFEVAEGNGINH